MPKSHQRHSEWTPQRLIDWGGSIGPATQGLIDLVLGRYTHPEQGFRSALGILRLAKNYDHKRLEAAAQRAIAIGAYSYKSVMSILKNGLDRELIASASQPSIITHENIRGSSYFNS
jgi:transposase